MSELVTDYLDRALPRGTRLQARLHLALCRACQRYFRQMRQTVQLLARAPRVVPPPDIEQRIIDAAKPGGPDAYTASDDSRPPGIR